MTGLPFLSLPNVQAKIKQIHGLMGLQFLFVPCCCWLNRTRASLPISCPPPPPPHPSTTLASPPPTPNTTSTSTHCPCATTSTRTTNNNNKVEPYTAAPLPFWLWLLPPLVRPYTIVHGSPFRHVHGASLAGCTFSRFATTALLWLLSVRKSRHVRNFTRSRRSSPARTRLSDAHPRTAPRPCAPARVCAPLGCALAHPARARTDPCMRAVAGGVGADGARARVRADGAGAGGWRMLAVGG